MSNPIGDRNLLFGIFGFERHIISPDLLVTAMKRWILDKRKGLAQILRDLKAINENQHALLEEIVDGHLAKHGNDTQKALAAVSLTGAARQGLEAIADADVRASLAKVPSVAKPPEPEVTEIVAPDVITVVAPVKLAANKRPKPKATPTPRRGTPVWVWLAGGAVAMVAVLVLASAAVIVAIVQTGGLRSGDNRQEALARAPAVEGDVKPKAPDKVDPPAKDPDAELVVKLSPAPAKPEFVSLFNGKDLTGWKALGQQGQNWRVQDGILIGSGNPGGRLHTERLDFGDFHLRVEARISDKGAGGIGFRNPFGSLQGYEAAINSTHIDKFRTGGLHLRLPTHAHLPRNADPQVPPDQWFTMEIIADGARFVVKVNGVTTADVTDRSHELAVGHITLNQIAQSVIEFRKIEIKELRPAAPLPLIFTPEIFLEDKDFVPLFNGKDLTGWKTNPLAAGDWRVVNGILTGSTEGANQAYLFSNRDDYQDFHLRARVRSIGDSGSVVARAGFNFVGQKAHLNFQGFTGALYMVGKGPHRFGGKGIPLPESEWVDLEMIARGHRLIIKVNGKETTDFTDTNREFARGHIALQHHRNSTLEVRRIEVKQLVAAPIHETPPPPLPAGFVSLFNGKDLTGWKTHAKQLGDWKVKDGVLVGFGPNLSSLYSERADYRDYHLRIDARINDHGLGGVLTRATFGPMSPPNNPNSPNGFLASINSTGSVVSKTGSMRLIGGNAMSGSQPPPPPGEWFAMDVIAEGPLVKVVMNGKTTANLRDADGLFPAGHIALSLRNAQALIEFRQIAIKELNPIVAPLPATPDGFVPLFNGKDLAGWHVEGQNFWRIDALNRRLMGNGPDTAILTNRKDYNEFTLRMDVSCASSTDALFAFRQNPGPNGKWLGLTSRFEGDRTHVRVGMVGVDSAKTETGNAAEFRAGEKFKLEFQVRKDGVRVTANGKETAVMNIAPNQFPPGAIGIFVAKGGVGITNLEIKEGPPAPPLATANADFVPLFNGKDLAGWQPHAKRPGNWRVENGVLTGSAPGGGSLYSQRGDFQNFHLRTEARINDKGFGRVVVRAAHDPTRVPFKVFGFEALINQRPVGDKMGALTATSITSSVLTQAKESAVQPGDWFVLEIVAQGDIVTVKVNGAAVADFRDETKQFARSGHIALQQDVNAVLEFRKIEIKELAIAKADVPPPAIIPPFPKGAKRGYPVSFLAADAKKWRIEGDELIQDVAKASASIFFGDPRWTDYDYQIDFKRTDGNAEVGLWFRRPIDGRDGYRFILGATKSTIHKVARITAGVPTTQGLPLDVKDNPLQSDRWYTAKVSVRGDKAQCYLDGVKLFDVPVDPIPAGAVGLRTTTSAYRFKNIKVTAPDGAILLQGLPDLNALEVPPPAPPNAEGFVPLFDGKSMVGWKVPITTKTNWRIKGGILTAAGEKASSFVSPRDDYQNFHLRIEARVADLTTGGVLLRAPFGQSNGYEVRLNSNALDPNKTGSLLAHLQGKTTMLANVNESPVPIGQWFLLEMIAQDNRITVKVNGKATADAVDVGSMFTSGHLVLRHDANSTIDYRKIELREFKPTPPNRGDPPVPK